MFLQPFGIHHVAIQVHDLGPIVRFYETVLRLSRYTERLNDDGTLRSVWLAIGPARLVLEQVAGDVHEDAEFRTDTPGLHVLALQIDVADREGWRTHLKKQGVRIVQETAYSLFFRDPEGNRLAVTHYPDPAPT